MTAAVRPRAPPRSTPTGTAAAVAMIQRRTGPSGTPRARLRSVRGGRQPRDCARTNARRPGSGKSATAVASTTRAVISIATASAQRAPDEPGRPGQPGDLQGGTQDEEQIADRRFHEDVP